MANTPFKLSRLERTSPGLGEATKETPKEPLDRNSRPGLLALENDGVI